MPQTTHEKRDRFARMFPPRVEKLIDTLRLLQNCTSKKDYEWTDDTVKRAWIEIAERFQETAKAYGLELEISLDGDQVQYIDTSRPLS